MSERILCDQGLRVALERVAGKVLLTVTNGAPTAFLVDPAILEDALQGAHLQLSSAEGYCQIERKSDDVFLSFGLHGYGRQTCSITLSAFAEALVWAKAPASSE